MEINYTPLVPWSSCNVPMPIQKELNRRKTNVSFNYQKTDGWDSNGGDWEKYKGPMRSWVRVCSNSMGRKEVDKPGFVLSGGKSFYQTYGVKWNSQGNQQVLGYTPDGKHQHILINDKNTSTSPIHVPAPEIVRVETVMQKELFRRAWIHWTCFSAAQLEYMTPYFLVPGITMLLEFGWNHFNPASLLDLSKTDDLVGYYFDSPYPLYNKNILDSSGNYDVVFGLVSNFEWSIEGNKINCMTEITSMDRMYSGLPISSVVAQIKNKENETEEADKDAKYFQTLKNICDGDFVQNIKKLATLGSLAEADEKLSSPILVQLIKSGVPMKQEYWRGVFFGRDQKILELSKWSKAIDGDFDNGNTKDVWVNMGFLVELINRCFQISKPTTDPKKPNRPFFEVLIDDAVIGAHPNLISTDGNIMLIPNAESPKYLWGALGERNIDINVSTSKIVYNEVIKWWSPDKTYESDYSSQFLNTPSPISKKNEPKDALWYANYQIKRVCKQSPYNIQRDNIDEIINVIRYKFQPSDGVNRNNGKSKYAFPFTTNTNVTMNGRTGTVNYGEHFYGFFKDIYFNVNHFVELVKDSSIKTFTDLYGAIFKDMNKAGGDFWDLALMPNPNSTGMTVVDKKMLPSENSTSTPWYFDYMDSNQIMTTLGFKPKMSDAQACKAVFSEANNSESKTVVKSYNDLLDFQSKDMILSRRFEQNTTQTVVSNPGTDPYIELIRPYQSIVNPPIRSFPFTIKVADGGVNKQHYRRLVLPDEGLLTCLLDDGDKEKNQKYTGIQPITVEVGLQGIGGLRTFMTFLIRNLPNPYNSKDVAYRIVDVHHTLQDGKWDTVVKAGIIPLRGYVKDKLGIKEPNSK